MSTSTRRVRTRAGAVRFGQPLGSVIERDVLPALGAVDTEDRVSDEELEAARALALAKVAALPPLPSDEVILEHVARARASGRAGGENRGNSRDRARSRLNLFREWGGEARGYVPCVYCGKRLHHEDGHGLEVLTRDKLRTLWEGGGYQLWNLVPACRRDNQLRGATPVEDKARELALETKAVARYVRTAAGAERFGLPIGARIPTGARGALGDLLRRAREAEPTITADVIEAATAAGGRLVKLEKRLKERKPAMARVRRNLLLARKAGRKPDPELAVAGVPDAVRYTLVLDEEAYTQGAIEAMKALGAKGYLAHPGGWGNSWYGGTYKGLNLRLQHPEHDVVIELQVHTPASQAAKDETHKLYEQVRRLPAGPAKKALLDQIKAVAASVSVPKGAGGLNWRGKRAAGGTASQLSMLSNAVDLSGNVKPLALQSTDGGVLVGDALEDALDLLDWPLADVHAPIGLDERPGPFGRATYLQVGRGPGRARWAPDAYILDLRELDAVGVVDDDWRNLTPEAIEDLADEFGYDGVTDGKYVAVYRIEALR